jgi:ubiquinone/menaquinone biosynthesis C-methylase UbiE
MIPSFPSAFSMVFVFVTTGRSYHPGMGWFRKTEARDSLAVTMAGVKLGDRFLSIGVRDPRLIAAIATKSGLTGRACAVDADPARATAGAGAIHEEGALVEVEQAPWDRLPYADGGFDVAIARDVFSALEPDLRTRSASEALRVLRGGGRLIVIESTKRARIAADALTTPLKTAGFAAVRVLAEAEALIFVEGIKKA